MRMLSDTASEIDDNSNEAPLADTVQPATKTPMKTS